MKKKLFLLLVIFLIWEGVCYLKLVDTFLFPAPSKILKTACIMIKQGQLQKNLLITLMRFFLGFIFGSLSGLVVGLFYGIFRKTNNFIEFFIYLTYPIPRFVLLPFLILIFGMGTLPKVIFIGLGAFFPLVINAISGINQINKNYLDVARHYGAKGWKLYKRVILPGSLPSIFAGLYLGIGITFTFTMVIEFLIASDGLGAMMWLSLQTLQIDKLFLGAIIVAFLNITFVSSLKSIERSFTPWSRENKHNIVC